VSASRSRFFTLARSRELVITTIPLLTKELATTFPFLKGDFVKDGILDGKEVYEFMPSTITVAEGDTIRLTFIPMMRGQLVVLPPRDGAAP
jgi:hypothetical protein